MFYTKLMVRYKILVNSDKLYHHLLKWQIQKDVKTLFHIEPMEQSALKKSFVREVVPTQHTFTKTITGNGEYFLSTKFLKIYQPVLKKSKIGFVDRRTWTNDRCYAAVLCGDMRKIWLKARRSEVIDLVFFFFKVRVPSSSNFKL